MRHTRKILSFFMFLLLSKAAVGEIVPSDIKTKKIVYRGGIVEFLIPAIWLEEYEEKGGGTFYEDKPDSGTLRLNVLSFESKDTPAKEMALTAFPENGREVLANGLPIRHYEKSVTENGEKLKIYYWEIAVPIQPHSIRLAIFSYTVLDSSIVAQQSKTELAFLDHSIRQASFSREAGVLGTER